MTNLQDLSFEELQSIEGGDFIIGCSPGPTDPDSPWLPPPINPMPWPPLEPGCW